MFSSWIEQVYQADNLKFPYICDLIFVLSLYQNNTAKIIKSFSKTEGEDGKLFIYLCLLFREQKFKINPRE